MTWKAFLDHPDIIAYHHLESPGQYLFLKSIHEVVVACFTLQKWGSLLAHLSVMHTPTKSDQQAIQQLNASSIRRLYEIWLPHISRWRTNLLALQEQYSEHIEPSVIDWPTQLSALADVIDEIIYVHQQVHVLTVPKNEQALEFLNALQASIEQVYFIHQAIRKCDYIGIYKYPYNNER